MGANQKKKEIIAGLIEEARRFRFCGPFDDPDEQTAVTAGFRHIIIRFKRLAGPILSPDAAAQLSGINVEIDDLYSAYDAHSELEALLPDIESAIELLNDDGNSPSSSGGLSVIADSRLAELRALSSTQFDFKKLIQLCQELNTAYQGKCYFATAMLTRALLDHVPPLFGKKSFDEVASNYGGKSFKGTMQHLQNASRNVADGHLHQQIRKSESLPTAQQVSCGQQLDALLEEVIRLTRERAKP